MRKALLLLWLLAAWFSTFSAEKPGRLFIIGGGKRPPAMMQQFVDLAGGTQGATIVVLPMASAQPETTGMQQVAQFKAMGVKNVSSLLFDYDQALSPETADRLNGVTGIFFSGGNQSRLTRVILGTPVHERLIELYRNGAVLGGTSAGAAVMSTLMITGDERFNDDSTTAFSTIRKGNVVTTRGLGFLQTVIVDQHFIKRRRHNRLITLALENPSLIGIGIDEATAIVVFPDSTFRVVGEGTVMVFDPTHASPPRTDRSGNLAASNIMMHLLMEGDVFDMRNRMVISSRGAR